MYRASRVDVAQQPEYKRYKDILCESITKAKEQHFFNKFNACVNDFMTSVPIYNPHEWVARPWPATHAWGCEDYMHPLKLEGCHSRRFFNTFQLINRRTPLRMVTIVCPLDLGIFQMFMTFEVLYK